LSSTENRQRICVWPGLQKSLGVTLFQQDVGVDVIAGQEFHI
jgi:hypothetical protein